MPEYIRGQDLTGMQFGDLFAERRATPEECEGRRYYFWCRCSCGKSKAIYGGSLRSGASMTCGHKRAAYFRVHGLSGRPEISIRGAMIQRCHKVGSQGYERYGARGVVVCARWRKSFADFYADMGPRPESEASAVISEYSIERIDNNGHYSCGKCKQCKENGWPANCKWATREEQNRNKRNSHYVTCNKRTLTVSEWSRETGLGSDVITDRIENGWPIEVALSTPPGGGIALRLRDSEGKFVANSGREWIFDGHGYHIRNKTPTT